MYNLDNVNSNYSKDVEVKHRVLKGTLWFENLFLPCQLILINGLIGDW